MIFEIDGEPGAAVATNDSVNTPAEVMFASRRICAGVPEHPEGDMVVKTLRIFAIR